MAAAHTYGTWTQYSDENGNAYWYDSTTGTSSWFHPADPQHAAVHGSEFYQHARNMQAAAAEAAAPPLSLSRL